MNPNTTTTTVPQKKMKQRPKLHIKTKTELADSSKQINSHLLGEVREQIQGFLKVNEPLYAKNSKDLEKQIFEKVNDKFLQTQTRVKSSFKPSRGKDLGNIFIEEFIKTPTIRVNIPKDDSSKNI